MNSMIQLAMMTGTSHRLGCSIFPLLDIIIMRYGKFMSHCLLSFPCHWSLMSLTLAASLPGVRWRRKTVTSTNTDRSSTLCGVMVFVAFLPITKISHFCSVLASRFFYEDNHFTFISLLLLLLSALAILPMSFCFQDLTF